MQKTTIFTVFFSILVVVLLAEFLTNNDLQSGWSSVIPPSAIEGAIAPEGVSGDSVSTDGGEVVTPNAGQISAETSTENGRVSQQAPASEVSTFLDVTGYRVEKITDSQLVTMGFEGMRLERVSAEGLLFQLLDLSDTVNLSKVRFHLTDGKNVYGVISEFLLADNARAKTFYENLRHKASLYAPDVKLNETNSFGVASFYLNDSKRLGTAFLTVLSGNRVFSFSYPKASHEFFKKLIEFLMA